MQQPPSDVVVRALQLRGGRCRSGGEESAPGVVRVADGVRYLRQAVHVEVPRGVLLFRVEGAVVAGDEETAAERRQVRENRAGELADFDRFGLRCSEKGRDGFAALGSVEMKIEDEIRNAAAEERNWIEGNRCLGLIIIILITIIIIICWRRRFRRRRFWWWWKSVSRSLFQRRWRRR